MISFIISNLMAIQIGQVNSRVLRLQRTQRFVKTQTQKQIKDLLKVAKREFLQFST